MHGRGPRNKLKHEGVTYRGLEGQDGLGFVVRLLRDDVEPPRITTVVKQPNQDHITIQTVATTVLHYWPERLYGGTPVEPESPNTIISSIERHVYPYYNPVAAIALEHLRAVPDPVSTPPKP